jgi:hypothetical protein
MFQMSSLDAKGAVAAVVWDAEGMVIDLGLRELVRAKL